MARPKLRPPTSRRRAGRGARRVNVGWWTTVTALVVLGILGILVSRGETVGGGITTSVTVPDLGGAITVSKVMKQNFDRVEKGEAIVELTAGGESQTVKSPRAGIISVLAAPEGETVAPGAELARVQTGPDFQSQDHWHTSYGVNVCGSWLPALDQFESDFHTHGDGLIHAHPRSGAASGKNANLRLFFDRAGLELTPTKLEYGGKTYESGKVECGEGKDKKDAVLRWALNGTEQDGNPANFVVGNGDVVAIAFVPEGAELPTLPPSTAHMAENYVPPKHPGFEASPAETSPSEDAGSPDAGSPDAGSPDAGSPDAGSEGEPGGDTTPTTAAETPTSAPGGG